MRELVFLCGLLGQVCAYTQQAPPIEWEHAFGTNDGEWANGMDRSPDGAIYLGGISHLTDVYGDALLVKMVDGVVAWQRVFAGTESDLINAVAATADGGCIVAGSSRSNNAEFAGNHGGSDWWVAKLDAAGLTEWSRMFGGASFESAADVHVCADGGFVVAGYTVSVDGDVTGSHGGSDGWLLRLSAMGDIVWSKALGGSAADGLNAVRSTADGGFAVAGSSTSSDGEVPGNQGGTDLWLAYVDAEGALLWSRTYGGSDSEEGAAIGPCADGGFLFAGSTASNDGDVSGNHGYEDAWVGRTDHRGQLLWQRALGGGNDDRFYGLERMVDDRFVCVGTVRSFDGDVPDLHGTTERDMWAVKVDTTGQVIWAKALGGSSGEEGRAVRAHPDGGVLLAGGSMSNDGDVAQNQGYMDMWVLKLVNDPVGLPEPANTVDLTLTVIHGTMLLKADEQLQDARITVLDASGRTVVRLAGTGSGFSLPCAGMASGTYTVSVVWRSGVRAFRVFVP